MSQAEREDTLATLIAGHNPDDYDPNADVLRYMAHARQSTLEALHNVHGQAEQNLLDTVGSRLRVFEQLEAAETLIALGNKLGTVPLIGTLAGFVQKGRCYVLQGYMIGLRPIANGVIPIDELKQDLIRFIENSQSGRCVYLLTLMLPIGRGRYLQCSTTGAEDVYPGLAIFNKDNDYLSSPYIGDIQVPKPYSPSRLGILEKRKAKKKGEKIQLMRCEFRNTMAGLIPHNTREDMLQKKKNSQ